MVQITLSASHSSALQTLSLSLYLMQRWHSLEELREIGSPFASDAQAKTATNTTTTTSVVIATTAVLVGFCVHRRTQVEPWRHPR
jgi:hypothetical protein